MTPVKEDAVRGPFFSPPHSLPLLRPPPIQGKRNGSRGPRRRAFRLRRRVDDRATGSQDPDGTLLDPDSLVRVRDVFPPKILSAK